MDTYKKYQNWHACRGAKGSRMGDIVPASNPINKRYQVKEMKILFRYYTLNNGYKNYHARVKLMDGPFKGKECSARM